MTSQESDFADQIIQDNLPAHTEPPRDTFLPWHRVRKEYIRRFQWNELTARMVRGCWRRQLHQKESEWSIEERPDDEFSMPKDVLLQRFLSCLMIPGEDLLDVRALW